MKIHQTLSAAVVGLALSSSVIPNHPALAATCSTNGTTLKPITFSNVSDRQIDIY